MDCEDMLNVWSSKDELFRMIIHVSRFREVVRRFFDVRVNTEAQGKRGGGERKKEKQKENRRVVR